MNKKRHTIEWITGWAPKLRRVRYSYLLPIEKPIVRCDSLAAGKKLFSYRCRLNDRIVFITFLDGKNRFGEIINDEK